MRMISRAYIERHKQDFTAEKTIIFVKLIQIVHCKNCGLATVGFVTVNILYPIKKGQIQNHEFMKLACSMYYQSN